MSAIGAASALCGIVGILGVCPFAQAQQSGANQPLFRAATHVVEVTVLATQSNGSGVKDLAAADLRLFDNNREQTIQTFQRVPRFRQGESGPGRAAASPRP